MCDPHNPGVLYYANTYAGGADASDHVFQIKTREDFESFVHDGDNTDKVLKVVDVSVSRAEPCIHIYPAVLALAKKLQVCCRVFLWIVLSKLMV